ncbi:hypothetical protein K402DRAFT_218678 [Aulographum hederae CBS 113979]|uniref:RRM domain-containing protein n=1 Tax=Aulographum hederae CBS 113979 TaxID=1176131 RepID=A0A6G1GM04_9PEZI|nr:hypothetical protein K402DRAFT_218678 [Aulographum hederae CBS 113979]
MRYDSLEPLGSPAATPSPYNSARALVIHRKSASATPSGENLFPSYFKHGVTYTNDFDTWRTVIIDNLPPGLPLKALLSKIRGGKILSSNMLDTTSITGYATAMIVFARESDACRFTEYCNDRPLLFPYANMKKIQIKEQEGNDKGKDIATGEVKLQARVTHLSSPTYPLPNRVMGAVSHQQATRRLMVTNLPPRISQKSFREALKPAPELQRDEILDMHSEGSHANGDFIIDIVFSSVDAALRARQKLLAWHVFEGCQVSFERDECEGVLDLDRPEEEEYGEVQADDGRGQAVVGAGAGADTSGAAALKSVSQKPEDKDASLSHAFDPASTSTSTDNATKPPDVSTEIRPRAPLLLRALSKWGNMPSPPGQGRYGRRDVPDARVQRGGRVVLKYDDDDDEPSYGGAPAF